MKGLKQELRKQMISLSGGLDARWVSAASRRISRSLSQVIASYSDVHHVLAWVNHFPGEVDLSWLISEELSLRQRVYLPRIETGGAMQFIALGEDWQGELQPGAFGIREPVGLGQSYDPQFSRQTVVLVPGLAFDRNGGRLGRGKSFYDTFLSQARMLPAIKIGVTWSLQVVDRVPTDDWDVTMDCVVTEEETIFV